MAGTTRRYSTGLPFLDRYIGGGLEVGSLLALTAPPASQSELLIAQLLSTRPARVVSTARPEQEIQEWAAAKGATENLTVQRISPADLLADPSRATDGLTPESFLLFDTTTGLESADRERYLAVLNHVKSRLQATDSVGILHCPDHDDSPPQRGLTLHRADHVWQIELLVTSREIKTRLLITKARYGQALTEPIPLRLTDRVRIDTSRRIA